MASVNEGQKALMGGERSISLNVHNLVQGANSRFLEMKVKTFLSALAMCHRNEDVEQTKQQKEKEKSAP